MKTHFTYIFLIISFLLLGIQGIAQPIIDVCLRKTSTKLEVVLTSNGSFTGLVSNIQLTIRSSDPTVTFATPSDLQLFCTMAKGGDAMPSGGAAYQKFAGIGFLTLSTLGQSWSAGTQVVLFSVVPSSLTPSFTIADDSWTLTNNGEYYAELNALDKTGSILTCGSVLSHDEIELKGKLLEDRSIELNWVSEQLQTGDRFFIEKSDDGLAFEVFAEQPASDIFPFQQIDDQPFHGMNYYRIKQIFADGGSSKSNVVEIFVKPQDGIYLFPNPTQDICTLMCDKDGEKLVKVYDSKGRLLIEKTSKDISISLNLAELPSGVYHISVEMEGEIWQEKVVRN